jgi:ribosomal protein S18 acetylase RimI-like enzyme
MPRCQAGAEPAGQDAGKDPTVGAAMTQALPPEPAGIVFRRCRSPWEQRAAGRLLAKRGIPVAGPGVAGTVLFGLWDLTAPAGEALVAVAATGPLGDGGEVQLRGIAVAAGAGHQGLGRRLVCEVADSLRTRGTACLVARPAGGAGATPELLRSAGFVPSGAGRAAAHVAAPRTGAPADDEASWWELEL